MSLKAPKTRHQRIGRIIATTAVIIALIVGLFLNYGNWMSKELRKVGSESVEETYAEVNQLFNEITDARWKYLQFMHDYMNDDATSYDERATIIQEFRSEIGFTYFYLIGDNGEYVSERGGSGVFDLDDKCAQYLRESEQSLIEAILPSGETIILFVVRVEPIVYEGQTYTAMAYAYNEHDLGEALKVDAYDETSRPYILGEDGIAIITSDRTKEENRVNNLIDYLGKVKIYDATYNEVVAAYRSQQTATYVVSSVNGDFYLSFQPLGFQGYMLGSFTPVESVEDSINMIRLNTIGIIVVELSLVFLLALFYIGVHYAHSLRDKNETIRTQDAVIDAQNEELRLRNEQLEIALDAAETANQAKTSFLSNVSHDIRTPMNAIVGFATLADREIARDTKAHDYLVKIQDSSRHLLNLINEVLDFSKIEAGKTTLHNEDLNIETIVGRIDSMMRPLFLEKSQTFTVTQNYQPRCIVEADELHLTQILINILSNANKYTPRDGKVEFCIDSTLDNHMVNYTFVIRDNGIGMSEEYLAHLYDAFSREVQSRTNKVQGTGLGMAITKDLVDIMGGTIDVVSAPGEGSTFTIRIGFRLVRTIESEQTPADLAKQDLSIDGLHILVAEDNALNAEIVQELLQIEGCEVKVTENGRLCAEEFWAQPQGTYDLILMDVQMPEMNGYEATRTIRMSDYPGAQQIPIIAMTANAFMEDKRDALDAGMDAHVSKPIDMKALKRTIHTVLEERKAQASLTN